MVLTVVSGTLPPRAHQQRGEQALPCARLLLRRAAIFSSSTAAAHLVPAGSVVSVTASSRAVCAPGAPRALRNHALRAAASSGGSCDANTTPPRPLAPLQPSSTAGTRLHWCLSDASRMPDFGVLLSAHLEVVAADEEAERLATRRPPPMAPADVALRQRLLDLRRRQRASATQDVLYALVLERFVAAGLTLTAPLVPSAGDGAPFHAAALPHREHTNALLAFHGGEAAHVVHAHVTACIDGGDDVARATAPDDTVVLGCATAQMAQVYYYALIFGYFVRAVDYRFTLDKSFGTLPKTGDTEEKKKACAIHRCLEFNLRRAAAAAAAPAAP
jgi:hypothetical protein